MGTVTGELRVDIEGTEADKLFFDPIFLEMEPRGYTVMTNVVSKKKVGFVERMDKILQKDTGCGFTPKGDLSLYQRTVEVEAIKVNLENCAANLNDTIWEETKRKGTQSNNTIGTPLSNISLIRIKQAIQLGCDRLFWFGDKASGDVDYNMLDGMWKVHIPKLVAANKMPSVSSGSGAPLATDDATDILERMWEKQDLVLLGIPDAAKRFYVSRSVYQAYMKDLEGLGGADAGRSALINGVKTLAYRSIPLEQKPYWDQYDSVDFGDSDMHRVLLTTPSNLVIATDLMTSKNSIEIWYERKEQLVLNRAQFKLGVNFVHPMLMVAAF